MRSIPSGQAVARGVLAVAVLVPALAAERAPAPTILEQVQRDLQDIQNHVTNAGMKLRHPVVGVTVNPGPNAAASPPPSTPARACCQGNIEVLQQRIRELNELFDRLDVQYAQRRHAEALGHLKTMRTRLDVVAQGVAAFATAGSNPRATEALQGMFRPFHDLRKATDALAQCCPLADPAPAAQP
jgi:hypothetical protein